MSGWKGYGIFGSFSTDIVSVCEAFACSDFLSEWIGKKIRLDATSFPSEIKPSRQNWRKQDV